MTTSQRELLMLVAAMLAADTNSALADKLKIRELLAEINAGSQELR